jgi:hypothetical protein
MPEQSQSTVSDDEFRVTVLERLAKIEELLLELKGRQQEETGDIGRLGH